MFGTTIDYYRLSDETIGIRQFVINDFRAWLPLNPEGG